MKRFAFIVWSLIVFVGCDTQSRLSDDTPFHLISIGEEFDPSWEVMEIALYPSIRKYYRAFPIVVHRDSLNKNSALDNELVESYAGDSLWIQPQASSLGASVLDKYCSIDAGEKIYVTVLGKWTEEAYSALIQSRMEALEQEESMKILNWIEVQGLDSVPAYDQIFLLELDSSNRVDDQVACDSVVNVHYTGSFLNGDQFDKSEPGGFIYRVCENGQLLKGIAMAVGWLHRGDKLKIILPSQLAFGPRGSANGVVPPYTPVIYEIQISHQ